MRVPDSEVKINPEKEVSVIIANLKIENFVTLVLQWNVTPLLWTVIFLQHIMHLIYTSQLLYSKETERMGNEISDRDGAY